MIQFNPKFQINQRVFHATRDSDEGIIINISYLVRQKSIEYEVTFGRRPEDRTWCIEEELSENKSF
jgi:hypothetical protein